MRVKPGYKDTEAGIVPIDWKVQTVGEIATVIRGASPRPKGDKRYYGGNVPRLMVEDVTRDGKHVTPRIDFLTEKGAALSRPCPKGTLTIVCSGTVGVPSFLAVDACIHDGFLALVNIHPKVHSDYLYHYFYAQQSKFDNSATHGGVFTNLTTEILREFKVAIPPLPEQEAIAEALADVDALLAALDKLIAKKRAIKQAAMQRLLTGKTRLPGFGEDWEIRRLGELFEIGSSKRVFQSEWEAEGVPFYRARELAVLGETGSVDNDLFISRALYESYRVAYGVPQIGDMLVTGVGTLGKVYVIRDDKEFYFKDGNIIWFKIGGKISAEFLRQLFMTDIVMKQIVNASAGTTVGTYTISGAKKTQIPLPPLAEQIAIADILSDIDAEITALEKRRDKTQQIKQGMMQQLLTGRVRLVDPATAEAQL